MDSEILVGGPQRYELACALIIYIFLWNGTHPYHSTWPYIILCCVQRKHLPPKLCHERP